jgi:Mg-chelatase subunit ChlD
MMQHICRAIGAAAFLLLAGSAMAQNGPADRVKESAIGKPSIEMVFVLDTTGSMGGLIEGAKQKIWSIVNDVQKSPSRPNMRIGLVAYRDHGDAYVTKVLPVTSDLDKVYSTLMEYRAEGGGDTPEDVRQAMVDGVRNAGWSPRSPRIAQILFLVGDAPPHDDYANEPDTLTTTAEAVRSGIIVNTIECGNASDTRDVWQKIARRGEGQFFAIAQDGGVQAISTPFDERLSQLGTKVGSTYLAYGFGGKGDGGGKARAEKMMSQAAIEGKVAHSAPKGAQADRAINKAINGSAYDDSDLIQSLENGKVKLDTLKKEDLPDSLQKLSPEARKQEVEKRIAERKKLRAEILDLSKKRDEYIANERKKQAANSKQTSFDTAVSEALKKEIAGKGIKLK